MTDTMKMFGRYALTAGLTYAAAKGWVSDAAADMINRAITDAVVWGLAVLPPIYAAYKQKV